MFAPLEFARPHNFTQERRAVWAGEEALLPLTHHLTSLWLIVLACKKWAEKLTLLTPQSVKRKKCKHALKRLNVLCKYKVLYIQERGIRRQNCPHAVAAIPLPSH